MVDSKRLETGRGDIDLSALPYGGRRPKLKFERDLSIESEYPDIVLESLKEWFPDPSFLQISKDQTTEAFLSQFNQSLPLFKWKWIGPQLRLHFSCRHQFNSAQFFFEMIHRWLLPGRRLNVSSLFSSNFYFNFAPHTLFTMSEMSLGIESHVSREQIEYNLQVIETEIRLGMVSVYHASRLLETHFNAPQQKNSQIQEKIAKLLERNPHEIDYDIFGLAQQVMVLSREEFKMHRSAAHLSRMIAASYLLKKSIEKAQEVSPEQRHVRLKMAPVVLDLPWGPKKVIGICTCINLLSPQELFEERHFLQALQKEISPFKVVSDSFYSYKGPNQDIVVLYLEIERENGDFFSFKDLPRIKQSLLNEIPHAVGVPLKSIFMPRNEEEILRYIVALSGQLRFVKDAPQLILMFDEQKEGELCFTVIVVRILFPTSYSIQYLFSQTDTCLKFTPDRVKRVGFLRKRYPKEATVFRVHLSSHPFLRPDLSIDLFRARRAVFKELEKVLGQVRDYTGGMLAKQVELIEEVQEILGDSEQLLEPFFHALYPVEARSFLHPEQVKNWFMLWKELLEFPEDQLRLDRDHTAVYVMGVVSLMPELDPADFAEGQLMIVRPEYQEKYLGYLFISSDVEEQQSFLLKFQKNIEI